MTANIPRTVNKEFHTTFATLAVTVLSIMLAFYGIMVINLAQQAQVIKENVQASNEKMQANEENTVDYLKQTDGAIRNFVYTTEPEPASANWSIPMNQKNNLEMVFNKFFVPSYDVVNSYVNSILGNFTEGLQEDENMSNWLAQFNITHFEANYIEADINLDELIQVLYEQFPAPQASWNGSQIIAFIDDNFSNIQPFLNWFQEYQSFYQNTSDTHSKINDAINGISQAYMDSATMESQAITQLQQDNATWAIQGLSESVTYYKALSKYYPSVFESLDTIYSSATNADDCINQYNVSLGEYEGYVTQYGAIQNLAYSNLLLLSVVLMAVGVAIPMILLGKAKWFESKLDIGKDELLHKIHSSYNGIIGVYIVLFVSGAILGLIVLWTQISRLIPPL